MSDCNPFNSKKVKVEVYKDPSDNVVYSPRCTNCSKKKKKIELKQSREELTEIAEMDKHEILSKIASFLGSDPACFNMAEDMFDTLKYSMAEYVLKHEFNKESNMSVQLTMWLEQKKTPDLLNPLNSVIHKYLTPK